jgi:CheY-like chemotaxis protein
MTMDSTDDLDKGTSMTAPVPQPSLPEEKPELKANPKVELPPISAVNSVNPPLPELKVELPAIEKISAIPDSKPEPKLEIPPEPVKIPSSELLALVVDDNEYNREIFNIALNSVGYEVVESESGEGGLESLAKRHFHLLILDLHMPGMDGRAVLRKLSEMDFSNRPKMYIIVITANAHMATDDIIDQVDYVMYKPINVGEFSEFVGRLKKMSLSDQRGQSTLTS